MTIDTTVTNGRFIDASGERERSISIHDGVVLESVELDDVWRTVDASGYLVLPGMIQPGTLTGDDSLTLARRGVTTIMLDGEEPDEPGRVDWFRPAQSTDKPVVNPRDEDALRLAAGGKALLELPVSELVMDMSGELWDIVSDESLPLHVTHGGEIDFPLVQFLHHEGHLTRSIPLARIATVLSIAPARWHGIHPAKGSLDPGSHGDLFVFDPGTADPYNESPWPGRIIMSIQRGNMLLYNGQIHAPAGSGMKLLG